MTEYKIAAIPTLYRGIMFRSRLEARWAAFFDRLGWAYEYEPFDCGGWSPDFLLVKKHTLVEVKPITEFDGDVAERMWDNVKDEQSLLLVGTSPLFESNYIQIGWWRPNAGAGWFDTMLLWHVNPTYPKLDADIIHGSNVETWSLIKGQISERQLYAWHRYDQHAQALWYDGCNAVQWEPTQ